MATAGSTPVADGGSTPAIPPYRGGNRGRGRGAHSRGNTTGVIHPFPSDRGEDRARAGADGNRSRGRGRGRGGRGGRGNRDRASSQPQATGPIDGPNPTTAPPPPQPGGGGVLGDRLTKNALKDPSGESAQGTEVEVCFICANPVVHQSVAPCDHRTCHICALRMRALYKTKACAHCRTEAATVVFTDDGEKRYVDFSDKDFYEKNENLGIAFESQEILEDTLVLLRYNCPDPSCDVACMGWPDLHRHVRSVHKKMMCDLCTRNKKVFTHEHELFTHAELKRHEKYGDDNPGAVDQSGFKGHPECGFCRERFYGDDELYAHCRDKHERCHLCDRRTGGQNPQYYLDYDALERHFGHDHFPCLDTECLEKKFVVFDSEMDLKAHQLQNHPNGMSKDVRRDARRVDMSSFDYRPQYQEVRRGGRRGGGRGRDPNTDQIPATSGGHMSRAEVAHQREREIQSAQNVTSRTFGGQLSQPEPAQTVHRPSGATQSPRPSPRPGNAVLAVTPQPASAPDSRPLESLSPQEQARRLRHAAVTERAANLVHNDEIKLNEFRSRISAYRNDTISASDLIDSFFSLFDTSSAELGKLVKELAEIFEIPGKRDALLKAWADWKAINEDYPSLPGPTASSAAGVLGSGIGTNRVLRLKSSTAPSSRSPMSQQRSWGTAAARAAGPSSSVAFPSLPTSYGGGNTAASSGWLTLRPAAAASSSNSASNSNKPSPTPSRSQTPAAGKSEAFPALPAAAKPTSTVFSPGYRGAGVLRQSASSTPANAWGSNGGATAPVSAEATEEAADSTGKGKGKGRQGKKQIVFQWG